MSRKYKKRISSSRLVDMTGRRYGRVVVLSQSKSIGNKAYWICKCDCGNISIIRGNYLRSGHTISCGCVQKETVSMLFATHRKKNTPEYRTWCGMKEHCYNNNNKSFFNYGGRGIRVCDEWIESFEQFFIDMGLKPGPEYSIDRIDVDGNYEPGNCRWATPKEQANNTRRNKTSWEALK